MALTADDTDGLPLPERRWAVLAISVGLVMAVLNTAIVNIALPTIAKDLGVSPAASVWVVSAFQLAVTVSVLPMASLGDILGYRRVYIGGLIGFTIASLACAMSDSLVTLIVARVLQGFGAAGLMSVNMALVRFIYPRRLLGSGIGLNVLIVAVVAATGPSVAAAILAAAPWQWLFLVNVPFGIATLGLSLGFLPRTERARHRFDFVSAALTALTFGLLITGIDSLGHAGSMLVVAAELALAVLLGTALVFREARRPHPLLPVDLFRYPAFALSAATSFCSFAAQGLAFVSLPFYFQDVAGRSQVETGLLMTPWPLAIAVVAPLAGRLADRHPAGLLCTFGLAVLGAGLVLVAFLPPHAETADIVWRMLLCGLGFGFFQTPNNRMLVDSAPRERSGAVSGIMPTARLLGQTTGAALVAVVFALTLRRGGAAAGAEAAALVASGFALVGAVASGLRLVEFRRPGPGQGAAGG